MSAQPAELKQKLDQLQAELATRRSTTHFAHTAVTLTAALIVAGATGKLFWDARHPIVYAAAYLGTALSLGLVTYAVWQFGVGKRVLANELMRFEELKVVRKQLQLDDPASLLPSR